MIIFIRKECEVHELRTPIVPNDVPTLIEHGYKVYVESSSERVYSDDDYKQKGAIITSEKWYHDSFKDSLILGLKKLDHLEMLNGHRHVYFSHSYKNQKNSKEIIEAFQNSKSTLFDFEYFTSNGKRCISFGIQAGIVGATLGLLLHAEKTLKSLSPDVLAKCVPKNTDAKVAIIGSGRVCTGVRKVLDSVNILYNVVERFAEKSLLQYDIVYNCIALDEKSTEIWFSKDTVFTKKIIICDISCDNTKSNNPIQLYTENTTWENPVYSYNDFVDIISIANLPSLIPKESSDSFSQMCTSLLLCYGDKRWENANLYNFIF